MALENTPRSSAQDEDGSAKTALPSNIGPDRPVPPHRHGGDDLPVSVVTTTELPSAHSEPFGRYVIRTFHRRGGMGEIWRCMDTSLGREVAMKRLLRTDGHARICFLNQAQIAFPAGKS